jgi:hypothetical protein
VPGYSVPRFGGDLVPVAIPTRDVDGRARNHQLLQRGVSFGFDEGRGSPFKIEFRALLHLDRVEQVENASAEAGEVIWYRLILVWHNKNMLVVAHKWTSALTFSLLQFLLQPKTSRGIRRYAAFALACMVFSLTSLSSPAVKQNDATQVIEAAMNAIGGRSHLSGLHSLKLDLRTIAYRIDDSEEEDGAPWLNIDVASEWRDEDAGRFRIENDDASAQWVIAKMVKIDDGHALAAAVYRDGSWHWSAQPSFGERLALSPEHILFTAAAAPDLKVEPDETVNGEPQEVLSFS